MSKEITAFITKKEYNNSYLTLWNGILGLSNTDTGLLIEFIDKYQLLKEQGINDKNILSNEIFGTANRKALVEKLKINENILNNRIASLKKKGVIHFKDGIYFLDQKIIPITEITFKFVIK